jgi:hypothetical protein
MTLSTSPRSRQFDILKIAEESERDLLKALVRDIAAGAA